MNQTLAVIFGMPGWAEFLLLAALGVLIFGKRLPEVGRSLGKGIVEFKKGISGIEDELDQASTAPSAPRQINKPQETPTVDTSTVQQSAPVESSDTDKSV